MKKTIVINTVALTKRLLVHAPRISAFVEQGNITTIRPGIPAVTCSVQATYLTGKKPRDHGIIGNGWYFRDEAEVKFWRQSNKLVQGEKIWDMARAIDPSCTTANIFWWYNMNSSADYSITPRPMYPADGRKLPDIHTVPYDIRKEIQKNLGQFPLFQFWGPRTSIVSSEWIAKSAIWIDERKDPTLTLIYLPHLDYALQRMGPDSKEVIKDIQELDSVVGDLIDYYKKQHAEIIILSEYGILPVSKPVHINRVLRSHGYIATREELGREILDTTTSKAFAVADHQVAHVYIKDVMLLPSIKKILLETEGVDEVWGDQEKHEHGLDHERSGDLIVLAERDAWFTYYYWEDDERAPDFARTVDIHRKPGYDPVELFIDPNLRFPMLKVAWTLLKKKLGFRTLLEVIPLDASLVKGSHGRIPLDQADMPIFITSRKDEAVGPMMATEVCDRILTTLTSNSVPK